MPIRSQSALPVASRRFRVLIAARSGQHEVLTYELALDGCDVEFCSPQELAEHAHGHHLVITGPMSPAEIHRFKSRSRAALIIAAPHFSPELAMECMAAGAFGLIREPYDLDEMLDLVAAALTACPPSPLRGLATLASHLARTETTEVARGLIIDEVRAMLDADAFFAEGEFVDMGSDSFPVPAAAENLVVVREAPLDEDERYLVETVAGLASMAIAGIR